MKHSPKNWVQERIGLEFREEAGAAMFYPPIAIRAKSGYGKSMLFGKIIAELIDAKFTRNDENEWPVYNRIVYSQLKDQMASNLEEAVCRGMDKFHQCSNLETFFELTKETPAGQKILFIDSLDEHPKPKSGGTFLSFFQRMAGEWYGLAETLTGTLYSSVRR